ncbi:MAG: RDD family protein [Planctomycetes bacterium]|nr:RDD family protein [Planctomycetota bacterium]
MPLSIYRRRRRLAIVIAVTSAVLLAVWEYHGLFPEAYSDPLVVSTPESLVVTHRGGQLESEQIVQYLVALDPATLEVKQRTFYYDPTLVPVTTRDGLVAFFGRAYRSLSEDHPAQLDQDWSVLAVARDPATETLWLFGVHEGSVVARRLRDGAADAPEIVAHTRTEVDHLTATWSDETGPTVLWKEKEQPAVHAARRRGEKFEPMADFSVGDARHWTSVAVGSRQILIYFDRKDKSLSTLTLQVRCCAACNQPPPPSQWTFKDRYQILARRVTGLALATEHDRLRLVLARMTVLQSTTIPLATLAPEPGTALTLIRTMPDWRRWLGLLMPSVLLFFSFSLVYLGFVLLRERRRALAESLGMSSAPVSPYADTMQRIMAHLLDQMLLAPLFYVTGLVPESPDLSFWDPAMLMLIGAGYLVHAVYGFALEAWCGQTIGKRLVGIRVIDRGRNRLSVWRALTRNVLRCVDAYHLLAVVGLASIIATRRKQRIGDLIAGTVVVQTAEEEPARSTDEKACPR